MGRIVLRHMRANGDSKEHAEARVAVNDKLNAQQARCSYWRGTAVRPAARSPSWIIPLTEHTAAAAGVANARQGQGLSAIVPPPSLI